ncbi:putative protein phosphatase 2c domain containing protein [Phaeoacremonium minimum UCRPA7]|uniref:PPM-type phosphatase domain-containing protein n=1 Tax=Phaeoacremonium minimum (strain UCR-PA7) TaxID=1286976 RepID=R8BAF3_PHAM7|nr:putative protein phosphatase 2c domain containing protein [Phaeoacremonium minimum UCRPA7]EON96268.1 putative protein phosphatase 2c domain containing protein [Phaeoacremonium minimum UCRPA7]
MPSRDLTVVRIPLRSAKHHFGAFSGRGTRVYNEDTNQAGTIDIPAFAKRAPMSLVRSKKDSREATTADSSFGDPQIFYFGVFDGHGGSECSEFLREELHAYIEEAAEKFELGSSLRKKPKSKPASALQPGKVESPDVLVDSSEAKHEALEQVDLKSGDQVKEELNLPETSNGGIVGQAAREPRLESAEPAPVQSDVPKAADLERDLVTEYRNTIGGYFRRFKPPYFHLDTDPEAPNPRPPVTIESVLSYAFLRADLDFVTAQARKPDPDDPYVSDNPLNTDEILGAPHHHRSVQGIGGSARFKGGSTASIILISTPTPAPFWHPAAHSTIVVAHVGDTRVLLCETATGLAMPLTSDHHPSSPQESRRLTRYAESLVTDSFGEERISGLANSRAFGDVQSKRIGVSAEPEITRVDLGPAQYSFVVLMSDGVSGTLSDQEIVDVIKEARTPEEGARAVVEYATEISSEGDNATCLVVRLGGWERRSEGGLGSLGTKEIRDIRRAEALDPRRGRR